MKKCIVIDLDSFFPSASLLARPEIKNRPVAVGGQKSRGVISSANYVARARGVKSAMPIATAMGLCPELIILPAEFDLYRKLSEQIKEIITRYTDQFYSPSMDEFYIDTTDCLKCRGSAKWIAQEIRTAIRVETGLFASAGVSYCLYLAKIASDEAKPNGIFLIKPNDASEFLYDMPLSKIPGVGPVTTRRLEDLGLNTCGDVLAKGEEFILRQFKSFGPTLWDRCNGVDDRPIVREDKRKSVGVENTLERNISSFNECMNEIRRMIPTLEERMSRKMDEREIYKLKIKVKFSDFEIASAEKASRKVDMDIASGLVRGLLEKSKGRGIRLIGISIGLREIEVKNQLSLL